MAIKEPSVICTLLKSHLRNEELPASVEDSRELADGVEKGANLLSKIDAVIETLDNMPSIRSETLEALIRMFKLISQTKGNLMSVENLGLAVGRFVQVSCPLERTMHFPWLFFFSLHLLSPPLASTSDRCSRSHIPSPLPFSCHHASFHKKARQFFRESACRDAARCLRFS